MILSYDAMQSVMFFIVGAGFFFHRLAAHNSHSA
jgi:hypothetical protein